MRLLGHEVRGVTCAPTPLAACGGDVSQAGSWHEHAAGCDLVVHTAARVSFGSGQSATGGQCGRYPPRARRRGGGRAQRFVHLSSVVAFRLRFPDGVDERHPVRSKRRAVRGHQVASEQVVLQAHAEGEIDHVSCRDGNGPQVPIAPM